MSESAKPNGDVTSENEESKPPRRPRINRRGLHLINNPLASLMSSDNSTQKDSGINGDKEGSDKAKADSSQRKIICLRPPGENTPVKVETKTVILGKSSEKKEDSESSEVSSSCNPPPKKKHKPITWP